MDANERFARWPRPPPCVATSYKDSRSGRNLYRNRLGRISVRTHAGDLHREPRVETSYLGSHFGAAGLELVRGDVGAVLGYDARSRRHGDSGASTRRQQATSRSSSEYKRNWSGAVAPTTW